MKMAIPVERKRQRDSFNREEKVTIALSFVSVAKDVVSGANSYIERFGESVYVVDRWKRESHNAGKVFRKLHFDLSKLDWRLSQLRNR